jgi:diguanylate cyclase (GGDEF)-like protein
MVPILIGAALQFMFYGLSLAWLSAAIGLTGLYMMQQNEFAYIDPLVETYNRQYLNQIVTAWSNRGIHFSGVMVDLDYFKNINDKYGHSEGDRALKNVTDILKESRLDREWVFRFAGDEFIILKMTQGPDSMQEYLSRVEERVEAFNRGRRKYLLSLSYGISYCESGDIDAFIKEMDEQMYQMKAQHHIDAGGGRA